MSKIRSIVIWSAIIHIFTTYSFGIFSVFVAFCSALLALPVVIFFKVLNNGYSYDLFRPILNQYFFTFGQYSDIGIACVGIVCTGIFLYAFWRTCMTKTKYTFFFLIAMILLFIESCFKIIIQIDGVKSTDFYQSVLRWYIKNPQLFIYLISYTILSIYFYTQVTLKNNLQKVLSLLCVGVVFTAGLAPLLIKYLGILSFLLELVLIFIGQAFGISLILIGIALLWIYTQASSSSKSQSI